MRLPSRRKKRGKIGDLLTDHKCLNITLIGLLCYARLNSDFLVKSIMGFLTLTAKRRRRVFVIVWQFLFVHPNPPV